MASCSRSFAPVVDSKISGAWSLSAMTIDDTILNNTELEYYAFLELNSNGTYRFERTVNVENYFEKGVWADNEDAIALNPGNGKIRLIKYVYDGNLLMFNIEELLNNEYIPLYLEFKRK